MAERDGRKLVNVRLLLIRHGETDHNSENRLSGWTDSTLSLKGIEQAKHLQQRLRNIPVDCVVTSGMIRAEQTAELVFPDIYQTGLVRTISSLKEMNFGKMENMTMESVRLAFPEAYHLMMQKRGLYSFPEGESLYTFHQRVVTGAKHLREEVSGELVAVVVHSGTIRCLLAEWIAGDWRAHWRFQINHCSVSLVEFKESFPVLKFCNNTSHLSVE